MVRCLCQANGVDTNCGIGFYLTMKIAGVNEVMQVSGFLALSDGIRQKILGEYQYWLDEYYKHVESEGMK